MSLKIVSVKVEPGWEDPTDSTDASTEEDTNAKAVLLRDSIKEELDTVVQELYNDHQIKDEVVLGPELMYPLEKARVALEAVEKLWEDCKESSSEKGCQESTEPAWKVPSPPASGEPSNICKTPPPRDCFVKLERLPLHNVTKPSCNQTSLLKSAKEIFICATCGEQFKEKQSLIHHVRVHIRVKPYACDICKKAFACKKYLRKHVLVHIDKPFSCNLCNTKFTLKNSFSVHQIIHMTDKYVSCQVCDKKFAWQKSLERHERIHTREKVYNCKTCGDRFIDRGALVIHLREHKENRPQSLVDSNDSTSHSHLNILKLLHSVEKQYSCDICQKQFSYISSLNNHKRGHTGVQGGTTKEVNKKSYQCEICQTRYTTTSSLNRHKRSHMKELPFPCTLCKMKFHRKDFLRNHERKTHVEFSIGETRGKNQESNQKRLQIHSCEICEKKFTTTTRLVIHKRIHTGEKPYTCEICNDSFRHKSTLTSHIELHTGKKSHACDMCESRYTTSSNLRAHKRSVHFLV